MSALIYFGEGGETKRVFLPASSAPEAQISSLLAAGRLPFDTGAPYIVLDDTHPAASVALSRLVVDWQAGTVEIGEATPPEPAVPQQVPARLALRLLLRDGWFGPAVTTPDQLNATVEGFLAQSLPTADARNAAVFDWRRSAVFMHGNPLIRAMLPALGKTLADLDALMIEADEIRAQEEGAA